MDKELTKLLNTLDSYYLQSLLHMRLSYYNLYFFLGEIKIYSYIFFLVLRQALHKLFHTILSPVGHYEE